MSDQQITCSECGGGFVFTEAEQEFYATKGLAAPPKRCKTCRQARRAAREGGGDARGGDSRGGGGFGGRPQVRSFSNDRGFRGAGAGAAGGGGDRGAGGNDRSFGGAGARPMRGSDRNGPPRGPGAFRGPGGAGGGGERTFAPRGPGAGSGGFGGGERPRARQEWGSGTRPDGGAPNRRGPGGGRPERNDRPRRDAADASAAPQAPRAARPRPERPRFDITCATCGAQAQVPFKPLEGRQVFCQACYRARKGPPPGEAGALGEGNETIAHEAGGVEPVMNPIDDQSVENDAGIVE